ncbi:4432_t:CDS:2 [Diversispora eburnea]|uniref:4432_t:CDS:1 n=1 Tax=Diversispora eburnea TaxID=1213867 RepID=A0A9N8ZT10_9GLOM|nr:4432_t:CDS:2 [Diversispora eburnea]
MTDNNTSPLLAATTQADDSIPYVVLNTSIGSPPTSPISRQEISSQQPPAPMNSHSREISPEVNIDSENGGDIRYNPSESSVSDIHSQNVVPFYRQPQFYSSFVNIFAQNFLFPFINGVMLGFGEICANEIAFRMGWFGVRNLPIYSRGGQPENNQRSRKTKNKNGHEINEEND